MIATFETGFYGEDLIFNRAGTRLYITDRFNDQVRAFRIDPGPAITQIAEIPTGATDLDRANPRDLSISADGKTLYAGNTLGHTVAVDHHRGRRKRPRRKPARRRPRDRHQGCRPLGDRVGSVDQLGPEPAGDWPRPAEDRQWRGDPQQRRSRSGTPRS